MTKGKGGPSGEIMRECSSVCVGREMSAIRKIPSEELTRLVAELLSKANRELESDLSDAITRAKEDEENGRAVQVLSCLEENLRAAKETGLPVCQDTGMAVVFIDLGAEVLIEGEPLQAAVDAGVRRAYLDGGMRCSVVRDPLYHRENTGDNTPALIHLRIVPGDRLTVTVAPKGFGSENMSRLKMFTPAATDADILAFVVETVRLSGGNACPPLVIGVGLGSDFEGCAALAKRALLRPIGEHHEDPQYAALETRMLREVNRTGIGPQGFGGRTTALAVSVLTAPTHIAGLPCAVNISCHVTRHASGIL